MTERRHLDVIDVEEPCPVPWDSMRGDGPVRFCGQCRMNVYNLSAMTTEDAESTVREREGRLCVRFYRRRDGTVVTSDCAPIRFAALRRRARRTVGAAAALLVALLGVVAGLGIFRLVGFDLGTAAADSTVGRAVKKIADELEPEPEPMPLMGAMPVYEPPPPHVEVAPPADFGEGAP